MLENDLNEFENTSSAIQNEEVKQSPADDLSPDNELADLLGESRPFETNSQENSDLPVAAESVENDDSVKREQKLRPEKLEKKPTREPVEKQEVTSFADLNLSEPVNKAIAESGYDTPTQIQAAIIPHMITGRDVLAQSQTGSGKTAAFALPILSNMQGRTRKPQVLVLAPTRELAIQVAKSFSNYATHVDGFSVAAIYGGQSYEPQLKQLRRGVNVVVGTPGRVIDHIKRGTLDLSELKCLVLDEADEMLNMGFLEDVEFVLEHTPSSRQIALFSATLPEPIRKISQRYLDKPAKVTIAKKTMTADSIRQRAVFVQHREKVDMLIRFLEAENSDGVIVFTRTRETTVVVADKLLQAGLKAVALNGDMPQANRERTIERLKAGKLDVLVATDVAARGLDVTRISHVFNYDLPEGSESYVHRVGRTGRAGRKGEAIIFLTRSQTGKLRLIERVTKQKIEIVEAPSSDQINKMRMQRFKETIGKTLEDADVSLFQKLITEFAETSNQPMERIAAAIAHMGQKGRPFLMKDFPKRNRERNERGGKQARGGKRHNVGPPDEGMSRFRISVGRRDGVRPGNIVGAVTNEAGLEGNDIGPIKIHDSYCLIDLPSDMPQDVHDTLQDVRVAGRALKICPARETDERPERSRYRKNRSNAHSSGRGNGRRDGKGSGYKGKSSGGKKFGKGKPGGFSKRKNSKAKA